MSFKGDSKGKILIDANEQKHCKKIRNPVKVKAILMSHFILSYPLVFSLCYSVPDFFSSGQEHRQLNLSIS